MHDFIPAGSLRVHVTLGRYVIPYVIFQDRPAERCFRSERKEGTDTAQPSFTCSYVGFLRTQNPKPVDRTLGALIISYIGVSYR